MQDRMGGCSLVCPWPALEGEWRGDLYCLFGLVAVFFDVCSVPVRRVLFRAGGWPVGHGDVVVGGCDGDFLVRGRQV